MPCVFLPLIASSDRISKLLSVSHFVATRPSYQVLLTSCGTIAKYDVIGCIWPLVRSLGLIPLISPITETRKKLIQLNLS